jgi:hypothetical protein
LQIRQLEKHDKHILFEEYVPSGQALIHWDLYKFNGA